MNRRLAATAAVMALGSSCAVWAQNELAAAIQIEDQQAVKALIDQGADVNEADALGSTPLMWAARYGDAVVANWLIQAGAEVAAANAFGVSAMSEAALAGSPAVIRQLLKANADPDSANPEGETALMLVARTGNIEAAQLLIEAGADVDAKEHWGGQSALIWAAAQRQPQMMRLLLENGAEVDGRSTVRDWDRRVTAEPRPKEMTQGGLTPLLYAVRTGCRECVEVLLGAGAAVDLADPNGVTPLMVAILNLHRDLAAFLIDEGADIHQWDLFGRTPLYLAIDLKEYSLSERRNGEHTMSGMDLARRLLERGASPNSQLKQWRPPFVRTGRGRDKTLSAGATPLLRAAHASDLEAMTLLLEHGALVDLPNASGITPLMAAAGLGVGPNTERAKKKTEETSLEAVRLLLAAGADVNKRTNDPRRLHTDPEVRRAMYGFIFQMAFRYSYLPPSGRTALHGAAEKGWDGVIHLLVENGAQVHVVDATGRTPWHMAMGRYEPAITIPPADPFEETVTLLETLCGEEAGCDLASLTREVRPDAAFVAGTPASATAR